ncbi:MAG: hypothetical protein COB77_07565 [Gammaproteobacteria bacterium]|nr:MAG: hypothetical protein COB77_07565 [Gammaproteobacteria bacterium]
MFIPFFRRSLLLLVSFTCSAEIIESIEYKHYIISPHAPHEIKPELMSRSPIRTGNGSFNGHTDWYIDWHYRTMQHPDRCQLISITTKVHVIYTLPALSEYVSDEQTITIFNKFNAALTRHEMNHGNHGLMAAREIDAAINKIPAQRYCHRLTRSIENTSNRIVQKYTHADNEYDRMTQNGHTEGAVIY